MKLTHPQEELLRRLNTALVIYTPYYVRDKAIIKDMARLKILRREGLVASEHVSQIRKYRWTLTDKSKQLLEELK